MYDAGAAAAAVAAALHSGIMRSASTAPAGPVHGDAPLLPGCAPEADPAPEAAGAGAMLTRGACSHAGVPAQDRSPALRGKAGHVAKGGPGAAASAVACWPEDAHAGAGTNSGAGAMSEARNRAGNGGGGGGGFGGGDDWKGKDWKGKGSVAPSPCRDGLGGDAASEENRTPNAPLR